MLQLFVYILAIANALVLLAVFLREGWRAVSRRRFERSRAACSERLQRLESLDTEELVGHAAHLEATFPLAVIAICLEELADEATAHEQQRFAHVYDVLGILDQRIEELKEATSWPERSEAADKLGRIGHFRAVLPLVDVLQDITEDRQVRAIAGVALGKIRDPRAISSLVEVLGRDDPALAQPIADVLERFGEQAVPELAHALQSSRTDAQRHWAARILAGSKDPQTAIPLMAALKDHSDKVRAEAARSLGKMQARHAVHPLTESLLRDPVALVREEAAFALGEIADDRALDALKQALGDLPNEVRYGALAAMEKIGERAIPLYLQALEEPDKRTRAQAATALERCGYLTQAVEKLPAEPGATSGPSYRMLLSAAEAGVVESIIQFLFHPNFKIRLRLCQILSEARTPRALEPLSELAENDSEWAVRARALEALIRLGDERARPVWLRGLSEDEEVVRECVVESMLQLPAESLQTLVPDLLPFLHDPNVRLRTLVVRVLGSVHSREVVQALVDSLKDAAPEVRAEAADLLGRHREDEVARALEHCLEDPEHPVRASAVRALGKIQDAGSIPSLAKALDSADESYRDDISQALAEMKQEDFFALTDVLMGLESVRARAGVGWALGMKGDPKAIPLLETFFKDPEPVVRSSAARALGQFGSPEIGQLLVSHLEDPDSSVRASVAEALGRCRDSDLARKLIPLLADPDLAVCRPAALAIGQLGYSAAIDHILRFKARADDSLSQAAAMIALELLGHQTSLETILEALQDRQIARPLRELLQSCTENTQQRFFTLLALDPRLFFSDAGEDFRGRVIEHYVDLLRSNRQPAVRVRAMQALSFFGESRYAPILESSLRRDPNAAVRSQALASLSKLLEPAALLERLTLSLRDPADVVRHQAAQVLAALTPDEVEAHRELLLPLLDAENEELQQAVCELLARCYEKDWRTLADILMGTEEKIRIQGLIRTLGLMSDPQVKLLLLPMLNHKDADVRELAAEQLPSVASHLPKEKLLSHLEDPSEKVRAAMMRCLAAHIDADVVSPVMSRCTDPAPLVRTEVAAALGRAVGLEDERPAAALRRMVRDTHVHVRAQALISLIRLGVSGRKPIYEQVCGDLDAAGLSELRERLKRDGTLFQMVEVLFSDRSPQKRVDALQLLAAVDLERYAHDIALSLHDPDSSVRIAAIEALGQHEEASIQNAIAALSQDPVEAVRRAVKRARLRPILSAQGA